jgi:hypothetical protein
MEAWLARQAAATLARDPCMSAPSAVVERIAPPIPARGYTNRSTLTAGVERFAPPPSGGFFEPAELPS